MTLRKKKEKNLKEVWARFERGDHISTPEMKALLSQAKSAMEYLQDRPNFGLALTPTVNTIHNLEYYLSNRKECLQLFRERKTP